MSTKGTQLDSDKHLLVFSSYEEYLDSLVTPLDLNYLRNTETARKIAELGYKSAGETLSQEDFHQRREKVKDLLFPVWRPFTLHSELSTSRDPVITELSLRERSNRLGILSTIIFVRATPSPGLEVSGFIDFAHRLRRENWRPFFEGRRKLRLGRSDMSFYNWKTKRLSLNETDNYEPVIEERKGILWKSLGDLKLLDLDPSKPPGPDSFRMTVHSMDYQQVVLYDHLLRCRN
ncbi:uncharacterized protein C4orf22 homolog [Fopius arisanus]|uniref:Cilia- and flagella-associated protein 299 n=1 Tax=Fopius arisanus TaxID=64838 RepID=A0A9R1TFX5_9HYME|nr:PREDICTED: uncharacterized protein C4orf22 homolog [Fopius arisanus]